MQGYSSCGKKWGSSNDDVNRFFSESSIPPKREGLATSSRKFQLAVWGATGFVGKLVCERIATEYPNQLRVVLAGRDRRKLESVLEEMTKHDPSCKDFEIMMANSDDREAIDAITKSVEVVISCAGPYRKYSSVMVASCVANRTHYVDTSVEMPWIRSNIRNYHEAALRDAVKVVHFCGIGSVPMDLGTLLLVQTIRQKYEMGCCGVEYYAEDSHEGVSGGSAASLIDFYASTRGAERKAMMTDPYFLTPEHMDAPSLRTFEGIRYHKELKAYLTPFIIDRSSIQCLYRSNALAVQPYGTDFNYHEGKKISNLLAAWSLNAFTSFFYTMTAYACFRRLLLMCFPNPGIGPSLETQRKKGFWHGLLIGYPEEPRAKKVYLRIQDNHGDPGYWSTSKMLLECALSLVLDKEKVQKEAALKGGVLTPALAFGCVPLERLKNFGGFVVDVMT